MTQAFKAWHALLLLCAGLALGQCAAAADNPHGLILEHEFTARYAAEVEPYWAAHAVADHFTAPDGLRLAYARLVRPGARAAVVIANGRTESYLKYKELAADLARAGYSVYIPDHRGQGLSPRLLPDPADAQKGHVERFDDYVDDLQAFVQQVVRRGPDQKLFLLAHSMGGGIATRHLERHPGTFAAAVLSSPMLQPDAKILVSVESSCWWFRHTAWLCPSCYAGFMARPYAPPATTPNDYTHSPQRWAAVRQVFEQAPQARLGGPTRRWAAEACAASTTMLAQADQVRTPLLMLQAGDDRAVVPQAQDAFCQRLQAQTGAGCNGPGGLPLKIDGASHELFIEADAYRLRAVSAMLDFFAAH